MLTSHKKTNQSISHLLVTIFVAWLKHHWIFKSFSCSSFILSFIQSQWLIFFHFFFNIISFLHYLFTPFRLSFSQSFFLFFYHINYFCYFFFWNLFLPFYFELVFRFCLFVLFFFSAIVCMIQFLLLCLNLCLYQQGTQSDQLDRFFDLDWIQKWIFWTNKSMLLLFLIFESCFSHSKKEPLKEREK